MKRTTKTEFTCDRCDKKIYYTTKNEYDKDFEFTANECWEIRLGQAGYGSKFDGSYVDFDVCDDCLHDWIKTFKHKDNVYNSGSNQWYEPSEDYYEENEDEI